MSYARESAVEFVRLSWAISFRMSCGIDDQAARALADVGGEMANLWNVFGIKVWFYNKNLVEVRAVFQAKCRVACKLMKYLQQ